MKKRSSKQQLSSFQYKLYRKEDDIEEGSRAALVDRYGASDRKGLVLTGKGRVQAYDLLDARIQSAFFMGDPIAGLLIVTPCRG